MKEKQTNKQNREEELKEIDLDSVSGGVSSASMLVDKRRGTGEVDVQSASVDATVDIFKKFLDVID